MMLHNIDLKTKGFLLKNSRDPIPIRYYPFRGIINVDLHLQESDFYYEVKIHLTNNACIPIRCKTANEATDLFHQMITLMEK